MKKTLIATCLAVVLAAPALGQWVPYDMFNSPLPTNTLISLYVAPQGELLVGTQGRGLVTKQGDTWRILDQGNTGVPISYPFCAVYHGDTLFVGSASGNLDYYLFGEGLSIMHGADSTWRTFNHGLEISSIITGIEITPNYRAVSTYGGGLTIFTPLGWTRFQTAMRTEFTYADSQLRTFKVPPGTYLPTDYLRGIDYDSSTGTLWIATLSGGAVAYANGQWQTFDMSNSGLPSNRVQLVKANPLTGKVYFGSFGFGLAEKYGSAWNVYNTSNSPISANFIHSLEVQPNNGDLWIGTNYGISVLEAGGQWRSYLPGDSNLVWGDFYSDITFDSNGNVWVATFGGGMCSRRVIFEPPPPPVDTLTVQIRKLKFFLRSPRRTDVVWLKAFAWPAVDLPAGDTVAIKVSSPTGPVYSWEQDFAIFRRIFRWRNSDYYVAAVNGLSMFLRFHHDLDQVSIYLLDWRGQINHANITSPLTVTVRLGTYVGHANVVIGPAAIAGDPDLDTLQYDPQDLLLSNEFGQMTTEIGEDETTLPTSAELPLVYPNPFNSSTSFSFALATQARVELSIYDLLGRQVMTTAGTYGPGRHRLNWDASGFANGIYTYVLRLGDERFTGRVTFLK